MNPPVIGIIICAGENMRQFVSEDYISAVICSGGIPVLIPCTLPPVSAASIFASSCPYVSFEHYSMLCDGYVFCGGYDISPVLFHEDSTSAYGTTDYRIDHFQLTLMKYLLTLDRPILAICKGMQLLNLALGGTIWQDLSQRSKPTSNHMQTSPIRSDVCHAIQILPDSLLGQLLPPIGSDYYVNSFHHQAIHRIGGQLKTVAIASDNIIEAIESTSHSFVLGVQWHPESMYCTDIFSVKIWKKFIQAASL